jgi:hypothetical protein
MKQLSEGSEEFKGLKKEWLSRAKDMTIEKLPEFLRELTEDYSHDYGTICHAVSIAAQAAAWSVNHSKQGGITGFQAGAIMWEFIREWMYSSNKTGLKIIDYDEFLFPQYQYEYEKTISSSTWKAIQQLAIDNMVDSIRSYQQYMKDRDQYKKDIAVFVEKYPDYYDRPKYYKKICMGTSEEWEAERLKEESGFEFSPDNPYDPRADKDVRAHWDSIIRGQIPFGYIISDN